MTKMLAGSGRGIGSEAPCNNASLRRLADHAVTFDYINADTLCVGAHEINGCLFYTRINLADLPDNFVCLNDLECVVLDMVDIPATQQREAAIAPYRY
jgi:hypothetical protein